MIGLVYLKSSNKIISLVKNVQSYTSDSITGIDSSVKGVDLSQAIICTVSDSSTLQVGDILNDSSIILASAQQSKITELQAAYNNALKAGFTSSSSGTVLIYGFDDIDQTNISQELNIVNAGLETFPITWGLKGGASTVSLTQAQFLQVCKDSKDFKWAHVNKLRNLIGQVQLATTLVTVNAIVW